MANNPKSMTHTEYLANREKTARMAFLARLRSAGEHLPISLAEDLLYLDISNDEKLAVLESTGSRDGRAYEHFLTMGLASWSQDLAAGAVRLWSQRTDHLLWFRILETCKSPHTPQRVFYTALDHAFHSGGSHIIQAAINADSLETMSPAFHGLLLHRAVQWNQSDDRLERLANRIAAELTQTLHPDNKALASAVAYLARFSPDALTNLTKAKTLSEPWHELIRSVVSQLQRIDDQTDQLLKLANKTKTKASDKLRSQLMATWLPVWARHSLTADQVAQLFRSSFASAQGNETISGPEIFSGITEAVLTEALAQIDEPDVFTAATLATFGLFRLPTSGDFISNLKQRLTAAANPGEMLSRLPLRLRLELTEGQQVSAANKATVFTLVKQEELASIKGQSANRVAFVEDQTDATGAEHPAMLTARRHFFNVTHKGQADKGAQPITSTKDDASHYWHLLMDAWRTPHDSKLPTIAQAARQNDGVFRLCYIKTLGRFSGSDQACLKLLDYIRSKEEDDIRAVIQALGGIGTPRAGMELVAMLTRPNLSPVLQLEACSVLSGMDLTHLQSELRSAIKDLTIPGGPESLAEVRDAIVALLSPSNAPQAPSKTPAGKIGVSDQQLDAALTAKIQHYKELSSEVKRALRTSEFFHIQVSDDSAPETIDLSPVIDMQYKALELLFRETFEEVCSHLINQGALQRRLDIIGYARPVPRSMDDFEAFVASLPIVRDIPFFSKFKLRKMLRAICQFRPGKRFTLDGLKAFALFFLCFSRQECRFGLANLFPLGFASDRELFDFCKALHVLQDFRNRAAHEGFHPDASNDIEGIWQQTAAIVQTMFKAKAFIEGQSKQDFAPKSVSNPIVEKKVS